MEDKTILIVDDTKENVDILMGLLDGFDLLVALDGETAVDIALEESVDLILMDIMMPGIDGFKTCAFLKEDERTRDIPIIFITVKSDEDSIEKAYDAGGVDYVTKPFKPKELLARVNTHLKMHSLIRHLEYISSHDIITGVYNRRKFFELGHQAFARAKSESFAAMVDIDKFKNINDTYGHDIGDNVIKQVAATMLENCDENCVLGRVGGEEFAIMIRSKTVEPVMERIETMRMAIANLIFTANKNDIFKVTISSGLARAGTEHQTLDELLKDADNALYEAKGSGRNKSIFRG